MITAAQNISEYMAKSYDAFIDCLGKIETEVFINQEDDALQYFLFDQYGAEKRDVALRVDLSHRRKPFVVEYFLEFTSQYTYRYTVVIPTHDRQFREYIVCNVNRAWPLIELDFENGSLAIIRAHFAENEGGTNICLRDVGYSFTRAVAALEEGYRRWIRIYSASNKYRLRAWHYDVVEWLITLHNAHLSSYVWLWVLEYIEPDVTLMHNVARLRLIDKVLSSIGRCSAQRNDNGCKIRT